jgi:hypothetical protein
LVAAKRLRVICAARSAATLVVGSELRQCDDHVMGGHPRWPVLELRYNRLRDGLVIDDGCCTGHRRRMVAAAAHLDRDPLAIEVVDGLDV